MACTANTPLEKTLEADILTLRKRGHFYFALTRSCGTKLRHEAAIPHCNFAYSALACFRIGMSGSASFERGWGTARAPLPRHLYSIGPGHTEANQGARDHNEMFFIGIQCDYENSIGFLLRQLKLRGLITENQHQG